LVSLFDTGSLLVLFATDDKQHPEPLARLSLLQIIGAISTTPDALSLLLLPATELTNPTLSESFIAREKERLREPGWEPDTVDARLEVWDIRVANADPILTALRRAEEVLLPGRPADQLACWHVVPEARLEYVLPPSGDEPAGALAPTMRACITAIAPDAPVTPHEHETEWVLDNLFEVNDRVSLDSADFPAMSRWPVCLWQGFLTAVAANRYFLELRLANLSLPREAVLSLGTVLRDNRDLLSLRLVACELKGDTAASLLSTLSLRASPFTSLRCLDLSFNPFDDRGVAGLAATLPMLPSLRVLDLSHVGMKERGATELIRRLVEHGEAAVRANAAANHECEEDKLGLRELYLSGNKVGKAGSALLGDLLASDAGLLLRVLHVRATSFAALPALRTAVASHSLPSLVDLDLGHNPSLGSSQEAGAALVALVGRTPKLQVLDVSGTALPFQKLAAVLCVVPRRAAVRARENGYRGPDVDSIPYLPPLSTRRHPSPTNRIGSHRATASSRADEEDSDDDAPLVLDTAKGGAGAGGPGVGGAAGDEASVSVSAADIRAGALDLSGNTFGDTGIRALAKLLSRATSIESLTLQDSFGRPTADRSSAMKAFGKFLINARALRSLDISNTPRSPMLGARALGSDTYYLLAALGTNQSLVHLDISQHRMGARGAELLGQSLQVNRTLVSLALDGNGIGLDGLVTLSHSLRHNETLARLAWPWSDVADATRRAEEEWKAKGRHSFAGSGLGGAGAADEEDDHGAGAGEGGPFGGGGKGKMSTLNPMGSLRKGRALLTGAATEAAAGQAAHFPQLDPSPFPRSAGASYSAGDAAAPTHLGEFGETMVGLVGGAAAVYATMEKLRAKLAANLRKRAAASAPPSSGSSPDAYGDATSSSPSATPPPVLVSSYGSRLVRRTSSRVADLSVATLRRVASRRPPKVFGAPLSILMGEGGVLGAAKRASSRAGSRSGSTAPSPQPPGPDPPVPSFLECLCAFLETTCAKEQGLFRISAAADAVAELRSHIDAGEHVVEYQEAEAHVVAGTLKLYLRTLPEPVIGYDAYVALREAVEAEAPERAVAALRDLAPPARVVFRRIMQTLSLVSAHAETNLMTPSNLGVVFGQTLCNANPPRDRRRGGTASRGSSAVDAALESTLLSQGPADLIADLLCPPFTSLWLPASAKHATPDSNVSGATASTRGDGKADTVPSSGAQSGDAAPTVTLTSAGGTANAPFVISTPRQRNTIGERDMEVLAAEARRLRGEREREEAAAEAEARERARGVGTRADAEQEEQLSEEEVDSDSDSDTDSDDVSSSEDETSEASQGDAPSSAPSASPSTPSDRPRVAPSSRAGRQEIAARAAQERAKADNASPTASPRTAADVATPLPSVPASLTPPVPRSSPGSAILTPTSSGSTALRRADSVSLTVTLALPNGSAKSKKVACPPSTKAAIVIESLLKWLAKKDAAAAASVASCRKVLRVDSTGDVLSASQRLHEAGVSNGESLTLSFPPRARLAVETVDGTASSTAGGSIATATGRICPSCGEHKVRANFSKNQWSRGPGSGKCKACVVGDVLQGEPPATAPPSTSASASASPSAPVDRAPADDGLSSVSSDDEMSAAERRATGVARARRRPGTNTGQSSSGAPASTCIPIAMKLLVAGSWQLVEFEFDPASDTVETVSAEMVDDLGLGEEKLFPIVKEMRRQIRQFGAEEGAHAPGGTSEMTDSVSEDQGPAGECKKWFGLSVQDYSTADVSGVLIARTKQRSWKSDDALAAGDVIVACNGEPVRDCLDLLRLSVLPVGSTLLLGVQRNGNEVEISIESRMY